MEWRGGAQVSDKYAMECYLPYSYSQLSYEHHFLTLKVARHSSSSSSFFLPLKKEICFSRFLTASFLEKLVQQIDLLNKLTSRPGI